MNILTLALKDLRLLWRDRFGLFWVLAFPLLFALFFGAIFSGRGGKAGKMKIAVVDEDGTAGSKTFVERLRKSEALEVESVAKEEARSRVRRGKLAAYVVVPAGFGKAAGLFMAQPPELEVGIDPTRKAEAGYLEGLLIQASFEIAQERMKDREAMRGQMDQTLRDLDSSDMPAEQRENLKKFFGDFDRFVGSMDSSRMPKFEAARIRATDVTPERAGPKSSFEITFPSAILWGILGCAAAFAISIVTERVAGTYLRLRISPLTRMEILAGKGLACFAACLAVLTILLGIGVAIFGVRVENPVGLALGALCTSIAFVGLMMFMCVLGKTEQSVAGAGWAILTVMAMLGGGMVPLMVMPDWMQTASHVSPVKWGIVSLEGAIWRGFTMSEMMLPCGILLGIGALFFLVGLRIFSRRDA